MYHEVLGLIHSVVLSLSFFNSCACFLPNEFCHHTSILPYFLSSYQSDFYSTVSNRCTHNLLFYFHPFYLVAVQLCSICCCCCYMSSVRSHELFELPEFTTQTTVNYYEYCTAAALLPYYYLPDYHQTTTILFSTVVYSTIFYYFYQNDRTSNIVGQTTASIKVLLHTNLDCRLLNYLLLLLS